MIAILSNQNVPHMKNYMLFAITVIAILSSCSSAKIIVNGADTGFTKKGLELVKSQQAYTISSTPNDKIEKYNPVSVFQIIRTGRIPANLNITIDTLYWRDKYSYEIEETTYLINKQDNNYNFSRIKWFNKNEILDFTEIFDHNLPQLFYLTTRNQLPFRVFKYDENEIWLITISSQINQNRFDDPFFLLEIIIIYKSEKNLELSLKFFKTFKQRLSVIGPADLIEISPVLIKESIREFNLGTDFLNILYYDGQ